MKGEEMSAASAIGGKAYGYVPQGYGGGDADVERVFGAELRYFEINVAGGYYGRVYSIDFVADDYGISATVRRIKILQ